VDSVAILDLARTLIDIDSTTGSEAECGRRLADYLRGLGWTVEEQPVDQSRTNVIASVDPPRLVFSTHFDCVPPFFPSRIEDGRLYGRGACDAKGILAVQVAAAQRLRDIGYRDVGLLFVVGEERGSDGAAAANGHPFAAGCFHLVNGEPTESRLGTATRGVFRVRLEATGRAAHSSRPDLGESAIDKLIDALVRLRTVPLPADALLGRTHYTVGMISGGVAPNVISPRAEAEIMFRTVGSASALRPVLMNLTDLVEIEPILEVPAVRLKTVDGFDTAAFPFTTDIPFLRAWGDPLLFGPGSVLVAHTDEEHVELDELVAAADAYERIAQQLL
jgi:acetylornithine deacetylase